MSKAREIAELGDVVTVDGSGNIDAAGSVTATADGFIVDDVAGTNRFVSFKTSGSARWNIYANSAAEAGGTSGSDFSITRYSDSGSYLSVPFHINRSTGFVGVNTVQDLELPLNVDTRYTYQGSNNGAIKICNYSSDFSDSAPQGCIENIGYTGIWHGSRYYGGGNRILDGAATQSSGINLNNDSITFYTMPTTTAGGQFYSHGVERMRITSTGSVLLGTNVDNATLTAQGVVGKTYTAYLSGSADGSGYNLLCRGYTSTGVAIRFLNSAGADVGSIDYTASATSYTTSSDYRLKEDIQPMVGASDRVLALKPVNFAWKADGSRVDGFLAHEAQEVVPEAVRGTKDAMREEQYEVSPAVYEDVVIPAVLDDEGNEIEPERTEQRLVSEAVMGTREVPDYQGIDQSKLVPLLTAALQEALKRIEALEAKV